MTEQEVRAAYAEKYKAFPDLVERILGQFDYKFWSRDNEDEEIELDTFRDWTETMEGSKFWGIISRGKLTREAIDAAYAEFGIENTNQVKTEYVGHVIPKGPTGNKGGPGLVGDPQPNKESSFFDQIPVGCSTDPIYSRIVVSVHNEGEVEITFNGVKYIKATAKILNETLKEAEKLHMPKVDEEIYVWDVNDQKRSIFRFAFMCPDGRVAAYQSVAPYVDGSFWNRIACISFDHYARLDEPVFVPMEKAKEKFAEIYGVPASLIVIEE